MKPRRRFAAARIVRMATPSGSLAVGVLACGLACGLGMPPAKSPSSAPDAGTTVAAVPGVSLSASGDALKVAGAPGAVARRAGLELELRPVKALAPAAPARIRNVA